MEIELDLYDDLKMIHADQSQIEQIITNLFLNARDAMADRGKLVFRTENVFYAHNCSWLDPDHPPGEYVLLSAMDNGNGMPPEIPENACESFFSPEATGGEGGIGLSVISTLVNSHFGFIGCSTRIGKGTNIQIYFPALKSKQMNDEWTARCDAKDTGIIPP